jgi:hypothetical protein
LNSYEGTAHETNYERLVKSAAAQFLNDSDIAESAYKWGAFQIANS